jgi:hypothetical protein
MNIQAIAEIAFAVGYTAGHLAGSKDPESSEEDYHISADGMLETFTLFQDIIEKAERYEQGEGKRKS